MAIGQLPTDHDESAEGVFADINITPLTDIFLVLLIIFMVTSSVIVNRAQSAGSAQAGIQVNLPQGGAQDDPTRTSDLPIAVLQDGRLVVRGNAVSVDELKAILESARAENPQTMVIVQADEGVPHGKVVEVMELAKSAGLSQLAIGVQQPSK